MHIYNILLFTTVLFTILQSYIVLLYYYKNSVRKNVLINVLKNVLKNIVDKMSKKNVLVLFIVFLRLKKSGLECVLKLPEKVS